MTGEQREQVAAQLEAVAKRLRAGEDVGGAGDESAYWAACNGEDETEAQATFAGARRFAADAIGDAKTWGDGAWPCEMHLIGWGITVWVERAQACDVGPNVCPECEGRKTNPDGSDCEDCGGSGEGDGDDNWECDYRLAPIPPNAVLCQHKEGPDTIEANGDEP